MGFGINCLLNLLCLFVYCTNVSISQYEKIYTHDIRRLRDADDVYVCIYVLYDDLMRMKGCRSCGGCDEHAGSHQEQDGVEKLSGIAFVLLAEAHVTVSVTLGHTRVIHHEKVDLEVVGAGSLHLIVFCNYRR